MRSWSIAGTLQVVSPYEHPELLAEPVAKALQELDAGDAVGLVQIDPELADTAQFCAAYSSPLTASANCVVVAGKRAGELPYAAVARAPELIIGSGVRGSKLLVTGELLAALSSAEVVDGLARPA